MLYGKTIKKGEITLMKTRTIATILISICALLLGSYPIKAESSNPLAVYNGETITLEDFDIFFMKMLGAQGLVTFLQQIVVYKEAAKLGLSPTQEERQDFIKDEMTQEIYDGFKELYSAAAVERFVDYNIMNRKYRRLLEDKFIKEKNLKVSDDDVKKYYLKNIDQFQLPERVQMSIISVDTEERAKEVLGRLEKGEDFNQLASIYNDDEELRARGGYVGIIGKGRGLPAPLELVAFSLEEGKYSQIIRGSLFHIVFVHKKLPAENHTLEEVKEDIREYLLGELVNEHIAEYLNELYKRELPRFEIKAKLFKVGEEVESNQQS